MGTFSEAITEPYNNKVLPNSYLHNLTNAKPAPTSLGLAVDWETTSLEVQDGQGIQIGAVVYDRTTYEEVASYTRYIKFDHNKSRWQKAAEDIHHITREFLDEEGITQEEAAIEFLDFLNTWFGSKDPIHFLGLNSKFDIGFTNQLLKVIGCTFGHKEPGLSCVKLHHIVMDLQPLAMALFGVYKSDDIFALCGYEKRGAHSAIEDIRMTVGSMKHIQELLALGIKMSEYRL